MEFLGDVCICVGVVVGVVFVPGLMFRGGLMCSLVIVTC